MKKQLKIELIIVVVNLVLHFLIKKEALSSLIYFCVAIPSAIYFFPVKIFLNTLNREKLLVASSFLISSVLSLGFFSIYLDEITNFLSTLILICIVLNIVIIYKFYELKDERRNLHLILLFLLSAIKFI